MKKVFSLIRATLTDEMSLFNLNTKKKSIFSRKILPVIIFIFFLLYMGMLADRLYEQLSQIGMAIAGLIIFIALTTILTLMEGIYKVPTLLFNCKDDNLMFSLPIKKRTVLFIRIFKFYLFELLYNTMFLLPAMIAYVFYVEVDWTYYLMSIVGLLVFPIIPIAISCIVGVFTTSLSAKFKKKDLAQIIFSFAVLGAVLYFSFYSKDLIGNILENAANISNILTKTYFPIGLFTKTITEFNILDLLILVGSNIAILAVVIALISKLYFKINSNAKSIKVKHQSNKNYKIKTSKPLFALIKKELKRFIGSPVFVVNAGAGLILFLMGCILMVTNLQETILQVTAEFEMPVEEIFRFVPAILFGLVLFASLMSSITSSMISLEGRMFNILKTFPIKPYTIVKAKVLAAVIIILPFILVGDMIVLARFGCDILQLPLILGISFVAPIFTEAFGLAVNLKFPKLNANNDTEVVKQSISSMISVFSGMGLLGLTIFGIIQCLVNGIDINLTMLIVLGIYFLLTIALYVYLKKRSQKIFNKLSV